MNKIIQLITAIGAAVCGFLFGRMDGLMYALIAFMALDYLTGVLVAAAQKELSSKVGFNEGISILENAAELGLPLPKKLIDVLKQLRDDNDKEE